MLSFHLVCFTPRGPRRWVHQVQSGREAADRVSAQLLGDGLRHLQVTGPDGLMKLSGQVQTLGVAPFTHSLFVVWWEAQGSELRWDRLNLDPSWDRYQVSFYPSSDGAEFRWESSTGEVRRHVSISGGQVEVNDGDCRVIDEDAEEDDSLDVDVNRLPAKQVKQLLADAAPDQVMTYDGRRYVRSDDPKAVLRRIRIRL